MKKLEINLPVFTGFYHSIFESSDSDEEMEIKHINEKRERRKLDPITWDDCEFDYKEYHQEVCKKCVDAVETKLQEIFGLDIILRYQALNSPREYNFRTDQIQVEVTMADWAKGQIKIILDENREAFKNWVKDNYTSYDGFMSFHTNNPDDWFAALNDWEDKVDNGLDHKIGAMLGFILSEVEEYDQHKLKDSITDYPMAMVSNYDELINGKEVTDE